MQDQGKIVGINVFFTEKEKATGEPKLFEYTYGAGTEKMRNDELFFINGVFIFVWNTTNHAYDIYPEHRLHSVGVVHENDNQEKPGRQIVSFGVPPEAQGGTPGQLEAITDDGDPPVEITMPEDEPPEVQ